MRTMLFIPKRRPYPGARRIAVNDRSPAAGSAGAKSRFDRSEAHLHKAGNPGISDAYRAQNAEVIGTPQAGCAGDEQPVPDDYGEQRRSGEEPRPEDPDV